MRLRHGVTAAHAIKTLRDLAMSLETARAAVVGSDGLRRSRDQYLSWVDNAENQLRNLFAEVDLLDSLHSERYWRIHNLDHYSARPTGLRATASSPNAPVKCSSWIPTPSCTALCSPKSIGSRNSTLKRYASSCPYSSSMS